MKIIDHVKMNKKFKKVENMYFYMFTLENDGKINIRCSKIIEIADTSDYKHPHEVSIFIDGVIENTSHTKSSGCRYYWSVPIKEKEIKNGKFWLNTKDKRTARSVIRNYIKKRINEHQMEIDRLKKYL